MNLRKRVILKMRGGLASSIEQGCIQTFRPGSNCESQVYKHIEPKFGLANTVVGF